MHVRVQGRVVFQQKGCKIQPLRVLKYLSSVKVQKVTDITERDFCSHLVLLMC